MDHQGEEKSAWEQLVEDLKLEADQCRRELREISMMLEQSQSEVAKLQQRNASISTHLQQMQAQFEAIARADIRMAYDSALDAQHRLFVMRSRVEKLQNDQAHLTRYVSLVERALEVLESSAPDQKRGASAATQMMEMLIQTQEAERQRLSREMHDGPAQALSNFILQTEIAMRLFDADPKKAREELANMKQSATSTFKQVRNFIFELRPMMLDDLGLAPTLRRYTDTFKDHSGIEVDFVITGMERRLESYQEVMIFRTVQDLLNNAQRYSQASQVKVHLDMGETMLRVTVDDNGKGFDVHNLEEQSSMGLKLLRERAELLGGSVEVDSTLGRGTRVSFQIPAATASIAL